VTDIVAVEEVQAFLGDDEIARLGNLQWWISGLSTFIRRYIDQPLETETFEVALDGTGESSFMLPYCPVVSLKTLTIDGQDVNTALCKIYDHGELYCEAGFPTGRQNVVAEFEAGNGENVPDDMKLAVLLIVQQAAQTGLLQQAMRGEYAYVFAPTKWPKDAREIVDSYRRKL
jgi:hypothetical protein